MIRYLLLAILLLVAQPCGAAGVAVVAAPGQSISAVWNDVEETILDATEGTGNNAGIYAIEDSELVTAGLDAGTYTVRFYAEAAGSVDPEADAPLASFIPQHRWSGTATLTEADATASEVWAEPARTITGGTITTYTGNTPQTGDAFARIGAPSGASLSADLAAKASQASVDGITNDTSWLDPTLDPLKNNVADALTDTSELQGLFTTGGALRLRYPASGTIAVAGDLSGLSTFDATTDDVTIADGSLTSAKFDGSSAAPLSSTQAGYIDQSISSISVGSNPNVLLTAEIAAVNSQTSFTLASGADFNDAYNGQAIVLYDDSNSDFPSVRVINDYVGSTKTVTIDSAPAFTLAADDSVAIFATAPGTTAPTVTQIREEMDANSTKLTSIKAVTDKQDLMIDDANPSVPKFSEPALENAPSGGGPGAADTRDLKPVQHTWQLKRSGVGTLQSTNPYYVSPGDGSAGGLRVGWNCDIPSVLPPGSVIETQEDPPVLVTPSDDITITHIGHDDKTAKVQIEIASDAEPGSHWIKTEITNDDGGGPIAVYGEVVIQAEPE